MEYEEIVKLIFGALPRRVMDIRQQNHRSTLTPKMTEALLALRGMNRRLDLEYVESKQFTRDTNIAPITMNALHGRGLVTWAEDARGWHLAVDRRERPGRRITFAPRARPEARA